MTIKEIAEQTGMSRAKAIFGIRVTDPTTASPFINSIYKNKIPIFTYRAVSATINSKSTME